MPCIIFNKKLTFTVMLHTEKQTDRQTVKPLNKLRQINTILADRYTINS